jgi:hypothetical protein
LLPVLEKFLSKFPSSRYLSSSGSYPLDLSGVREPAASNATASLALRVTGTHKPLHHDKVEIPSGGIEFIVPKFIKGSTCLERHTTHHQELQTLLAVSGFFTYVGTGRCPCRVGGI